MAAPSIMKDVPTAPPDPILVSVRVATPSLSEARTCPGRDRGVQGVHSHAEAELGRWRVPRRQPEADGSAGWEGRCLLAARW